MSRVLHTERLTLRSLAASDAEAWHAIWGDPEVIWWGAEEDPEVNRARLERLIEGQEGWPDGVRWSAVTLRDDEPMIGDVLFQPPPPALSLDGIEIGWHFRKDTWGRGHATEAARAVIARAFAEGVAERIIALVAEQNAASVRVAEKLGMRVTGQVEHAGLPHRIFAIHAPAG